MTVLKVIFAIVAFVAVVVIGGALVLGVAAQVVEDVAGALRRLWRRVDRMSAYATPDEDELQSIPAVLVDSDVVQRQLALLEVARQQRRHEAAAATRRPCKLAGCNIDPRYCQVDGCSEPGEYGTGHPRGMALYVQRHGHQPPRYCERHWNRGRPWDS